MAVCRRLVSFARFCRAASGVKASPAARVLAARHGLALDAVPPTGPKNCVLKGDVLLAIADDSPSSTQISGGPASARADEAAALDLSAASPPCIPLGMPALSPTMTEGNISRWNVKVGDEVNAGDSLAEVETDKASVDFETQEDGYVAAILVPDGTENIPVGQVVLLMVDDASALGAFSDVPLISSFSSTAAPMAAPAASSAATSATSSAPSSDNAAAAAAAAVGAPSENAKMEIPHYYLSMDLDMAGALSGERQFQEAGVEGSFVEALIVKACARALKEVPQANSAWTDTTTRQWHDVNIMCRSRNAVYTIPCADATPIVTIAGIGTMGTAKDAVYPTFTIDFLDQDLALARDVIGQGQSCVLTVGESRTAAIRPSEGGPLAQQTTLAVTLSCDHRTVDGAVGAAWLQEFKAVFQNPNMLLL